MTTSPAPDATLNNVAEELHCHQVDFTAVGGIDGAVRVAFPEHTAEHGTEVLQAVGWTVTATPERILVTDGAPSLGHFVGAWLIAEHGGLSTIEGIASCMRAQIHLWQQDGEFPQATRSFADLNTTFDANTGWGDVVDSLPHDLWITVVNTLDAQLVEDYRRRAADDGFTVVGSRTNYVAENYAPTHPQGWLTPIVTRAVLQELIATDADRILGPGSQHRSADAVSHTDTLGAVTIAAAEPIILRPDAHDHFDLSGLGWPLIPAAPPSSFQAPQ